LFHRQRHKTMTGYSGKLFSYNRGSCW
jgi:hypothetical protein